MEKHVGKRRTWLKVLAWIAAVWAVILIIIQIALSPAVLTRLANGFAAFAGCMLAARTGSANATYAEGYEMDAIASCIIGGASFTGGIGNVPGTFLGVIIFSVINYGLTFVGLSSYWQYIVKGLIIIVAVALDMRKYASQN